MVHLTAVSVDLFTCILITEILILNLAMEISYRFKIIKSAERLDLTIIYGIRNNDDNFIVLLINPRNRLNK